MVPNGLMRSLTFIIVGSILIAHALGCARLRDKGPTSYTTVVADGNHDPERARKDCARATKFFDKDELAKAEAALQEALIADVTYAPAHNNLGLVYYRQGKLYLAAWEFEYARRLMPESADVVNNLGMVYEAAGREQQAIDNYTMALTMDEGNPQYAGNLARALIRADKDPSQAASLLRDVALRHQQPEWAAWARETLALREPFRTAAYRLEASEKPAAEEPLEELETLPLPDQINNLGADVQSELPRP
jgi:Tfp pilus assembly protein PilF